MFDALGLLTNRVEALRARGFEAEAITAAEKEVAQAQEASLIPARGEGTVIELTGSDITKSFKKGGLATWSLHAFPL